MINKKIYDAAIYVRLSKEDGDVANAAKAESNSISNQKNLIKDFLKDKEDIVVVSERVDDGYSGSNFDRPAFQMMLEEIKKGIVNCVIVKDLSRFGREYIDSGMYIERLFPALGVRFIAVNDNYDSLNSRQQSDEIMIPFKNLINDAYSRDISIKIRSHLDIKRRNGEFVSSFVAYGYMKSAEDKHKLVIDCNAGEVVKEIFRLKLHGLSQDAIAKVLNERGILSPAEYKASLGSKYCTPFKVKEVSEWGSVTVRRILENEIYIGNLVQGRKTTPNHKIKKIVTKAESEWIRIEKNHEPLVSDRDFEIVQRLLAMDTRTSPEQDAVYLLSGIAVCADCGCPMTRKISMSGGKKYAYYICSTHKSTKECTPHRIPVEKLEQTVFSLLKQHIHHLLDIKKMIEFVSYVPFQKLEIKKLEEDRERRQKEISKCIELKAMLYEDMREGVITKEDYAELHAAYESRRKNAESAVRQIEMERKKIVDRTDDKSRWIDYFIQYQDIEKLTRNVVVELIREVRIVSREQIEVIFDFHDCYKDLLLDMEQIRENGNDEIMIPEKEAV